MPSALKPDFKPRKASNEAVASDLSVANRVKQLSIDREAAQQIEQERLKQQQIGVAKRKEQAQLEQERAECQQR